MLKLLNRSFQDFRASYPKLLLFEFLYMLLTNMVFLPVITFIFNRILMVIGSGSLLNSEVYRLGLSYEGVTGLLLIGLVASFALFMELCVLILLIQQSYFGKQLTIADAMLTALRQTPRLVGVGIIQLFVFLLILIPFIDSPLSASFYALFNFEIFVNSRVIHAPYLMIALYALLLVGAIYIILRFIFALHFIMLEGNSITDALRNSHAMTRGRRFKLFVTIFVLNAAVVGTGILIIGSLSLLPSWLNINVLKGFTNHYSLTITSILTYLFALLLMPIHLIFLTRIFYYFRKRDGLGAEDHVTVYRSRLGKLENKAVLFLRQRKRIRLIYTGIALLYVGLAIFVGLRANDNLVYAKWNVLISAHRGDMENAPENSLPSITGAIEKGIQSVEVDVQLTKDGVAVLHHDQTLKRMAGVSSTVADMSYAELSALVIGRTADEEPIYIPKLSDALEEAKGRIKVLLDLKPYGPSDDLVHEVVRLVEAYEMQQEVYIQSFDSYTLRKIRSIDPDIKIGQILSFAFGDLSRLDVDFYTVEQVMLTERLIEQAHSAKREVWVWTVNTKRNMREVLKYKIDGLITDHPVQAQSLIELNL